MPNKVAILLRVSAVALLLGLSFGVADAQMMPPPPMRQEMMPPPPPGPPGAMVWRPGYWRWDGHRYLWSAGRYVRPPHPHAAWIPGHWVQRPNGWHWIAGHWG